MRLFFKHAQSIFLILIGFQLSFAQTWSEIIPNPGNSPTPRRNATAIFNPVNQQMVIFSGRDGNSSFLNDVWAFDFATNSWVELAPNATVKPPVRYTANAVYDANNHEMIIWSGQGSGFLNDVWAFDLTNNTWTQFNPPDPKPNIRYGTAAVFDPVARDLVTFAGFTDQGRFDDTWRFDLDQVKWTDVTPTNNNPLKRCLHSASYDVLNHRMVIYGGQSSGAVDDIWAFNLNNNTWSNLTPENRPAGRWFPSNIYDSTNHRILIFGGNTGGSKSNEVWEFDLSTNSWQLFSASGTAPTSREGAAAIYIQSEDRMVIFGGLSNPTLNDLWSLDNLSGALPVELTAFQYSINKDNVLLSWETQSESNNYGFEIERSRDGTHFVKIGFITGNGSSNSKSLYSYTDNSLQPGDYWYRLKQVDLDGSFSYSEELFVRISPPTRFRIIGNYPNPFNPETEIEYEIPVDKHVIINIVNLQGNLVKELVNERRSLGTHKITWDGTNEAGILVSSGIFYVVLQSDGKIFTKKMLLLK